MNSADSEVTDLLRGAVTRMECSESADVGPQSDESVDPADKDMTKGSRERSTVRSPDRSR